MLQQFWTDGILFSNRPKALPVRCHFMRRQSTILIIVFIIGLLSCKGKRDNLSSASMDEIKNGIATTNVLMGGGIGPAGERPRQWDRYEVLLSKATDKELLTFTNDTNAVVRCYAFQALATRGKTDLFPIALQHIPDTATVHTLYGCSGSSQKVGDFFLKTFTYIL